MNGLRYKVTAPYGDPCKNGLGVWTAGQTRLRRVGAEKYEQALVDQGGFEFVEIVLEEAGRAPVSVDTAGKFEFDDDNEADDMPEDGEDDEV